MLEQLNAAAMERWRERFLRALRTTGVVTTAARQAGISREIVYRARRQRPEFAREWDDALEQFVDSLERVAITRARKDSERLLQFLLKAYRPDKFGDKVQITELTRRQVESEAGRLAERLVTALQDAGLDPASIDTVLDRTFGTPEEPEGDEADGGEELPGTDGVDAEPDAPVPGAGGAGGAPA